MFRDIICAKQACPALIKGVQSTHKILGPVNFSDSPVQLIWETLNK